MGQKQSINKQKIASYRAAHGCQRGSCMKQRRMMGAPPHFVYHHQPQMYGADNPMPSDGQYVDPTNPKTFKCLSSCNTAFNACVGAFDPHRNCFAESENCEANCYNTY